MDIPLVYVTSEANAYGAVAQKWFDGDPNPIELWYKYFVTTTVLDITEYSYLSHHCSDLSFYECLSSELKNSQNCKDFGGICEAVSLPKEYFPPCHTQAAYNCSLTAFLAALNTDTHCREKKLCRAIEYNHRVDAIYNTCLKRLHDSRSDVSNRSTSRVH